MNRELRNKLVYTLFLFSRLGDKLARFVAKLVEFSRTCVSLESSWMEFPLLVLLKIASRRSAEKITEVAIHCLTLSSLPKATTDKRTVKNFLVVVTMESGSDPKLEIIEEMKICPNVPTRTIKVICQTIDGCLMANTMKSLPSPVTAIMTIRIAELQQLTLNIKFIDVGLQTDRIRSWKAPVNPSIKRLTPIKMLPTSKSSPSLDSYLSLKMKAPTPVTTVRTKKYFWIAYDFFPIKTLRSITGIGFDAVNKISMRWWWYRLRLTLFKALTFSYNLCWVWNPLKRHVWGDHCRDIKKSDQEIKLLMCFIFRVISS